MLINWSDQRYGRQPAAFRDASLEIRGGIALLNTMGERGCRAQQLGLDPYSILNSLGRSASPGFGLEYGLCL